MKPLFFLLASLAVIMRADAQTPAPEFRRELSLFGQTQVSGGESSFGLTGLQFRAMRTEHKGFRVIGGLAQYETHHAAIRAVKGDTLYTDLRTSTVNFPMLGAGLELQRHFYRNIALFAAVELKGGYGNGHTQVITTTLGGPDPQGTERITVGEREAASLLYIGATASLGARLQKGRFGLSLELLPAQMVYTSLATGGSPGTSLADFSLGTFSQRIAVGWRF